MTMQAIRDRYGVPDPEPDEIKSARLKLEAAEREGRS